MRSSFKNIFVLYLLVVLFDNAIAQMKSPVINNVSFVYKNEQVEITYDIIGYSNIDEFTISLSAYKGTGEKLNVTTVSGDLNNVKGGLGKKIYWQQRKDGYVLDAEINFVLSATNKIHVPLASHLVKSVVFPGWGDNRLRNKKFHFVYGLAGYSLIASAIYMNQQSVKSYQNYKTSFDIEKSNQLFNTAGKQQTISYVFAGAAAFVWTIDLAGIYSKQRKLKKNITPEGSKYYYAKSQEQIVGKSPTQYINTKTAYDLAIERGDNYFKQEKYFEAKTAYEEALALSKEEELPQVKLNTVNAILTEIKNNDIVYNQKIKEGQELFEKGEYEKAKICYKGACNIKPKENYPIEKISEINSKLSDLDKEARYKENISNGNLQSSNGNYESAKIYYENALSIKPNDPVAAGSINRMEDKLAALAVNKKNKDYVEKMKEADKEFGFGNYISAKSLYQQAADIKPNESNPLSKIESCNQHIYSKLIVQADAAYDKKQFDKAKDLYSEAHSILPSEQYPINRVSSINAMLANASQTNDLPSLYNACKKAVFMIIASDYESASQGSGFFITKDGIAITNYHVIEGTFKSSIRIYTDDGNKFEVDEILEKSKENDYVIFKVKLKNGQSFKYVKIASTEPSEGEKIFTIGNPRGLDQTLSDGIVQAYREEKKYIQTSTTINHGSSGSPLFNKNGEVIGITTLGWSEENLFFAINIKKLPLWKYIK